MTIYTIGHSNRPLEEFFGLLKAHGIRALADVRTVPRSRHNPQFNSESLAASLPQEGIAYYRIEALGGFRKARPDSKNPGWRNASFRGYADYMETDGFEGGLKELERIAHEQTTAFMCAEAVPWRCHRSLIADALIVRGWDVRDIMGEDAAKPHRRTPFLKVEGGQLRYPSLDGTEPLL